MTRGRLALACGFVALIVAALMAPASAGKADGSDGSATYLVRMLSDPVVAYDGGVPGLEATKPAKGAKIDRRSRSTSLI